MTSPASYHHGNLRAALVETGLAMARESGPDGVALREVARRVGVSHNAAYRHFADREQLLAEIGTAGMALLTEAMHRRLDAVDPTLDPTERALERLRECGRAYVEFALAEPGLFTTAFAGQSEAAAEEPDGPADDDGGPYAVLNACLDDLVDVGYLAAERRPGMDVVCWAGVHGFAVLHLDGPLREVDPETREAALLAFFGLVDRGLGGGPG